MVSLFGKDGKLLENGLVEQFLDFVNSHTGCFHHPWRREGDRRDYPPRSSGR